MGTLRKLKMKMRMDKDWHKTLLRSSKDEIHIKAAFSRQKRRQ